MISELWINLTKKLYELYLKHLLGLLYFSYCTQAESRTYHQTNHQIREVPSFHAVSVFTHLIGSLAIGKSKVIWLTLFWLYFTAEKITLICHSTTVLKALSTERTYWRQKCYILQDFRGRSISLKVHLLLDYRHKSTTIIHFTVTPPYPFLAIYTTINPLIQNQT